MSLNAGLTCSLVRRQAASGSATRLKVQKPFDWTYTTLHRGTTSPASTSAAPAQAEWQHAPPTHPGIPLPLLARTDIPILFFDEIALFEDELGDNGIADVTVRVVRNFRLLVGERPLTLTSTARQPFLLLYPLPLLPKDRRRSLSPLRRPRLPPLRHRRDHPRSQRSRSALRRCQGSSRPLLRLAEWLSCVGSTSNVATTSSTRDLDPFTNRLRLTSRLLPSLALRVISIAVTRAGRRPDAVDGHQLGCGGTRRAGIGGGDAARLAGERCGSAAGGCEAMGGAGAAVGGAQGALGGRYSCNAVGRAKSKAVYASPGFSLNRCSEAL